MLSEQKEITRSTFRLEVSFLTALPMGRDRKLTLDRGGLRQNRKLKETTQETARKPLGNSPETISVFEVFNKRQETTGNSPRKPSFWISVCLCVGGNNDGNI